MPNFLTHKGIEIMEVNNEFFIMDEEWEFKNQFGLTSLADAKRCIDTIINN